MDLADSISFIQTIASIGRLAHEDSSLREFMRQILKFSQIRPGFELMLFRFICSWKCISHISFWLSRSGSDERTIWIGTQAVTRCCKRNRIHTYNSSGYIGTHASRTNSSGFWLMFFHMHPLQLWRMMYFISCTIPPEMSTSVNVNYFKKNNSQVKKIRWTKLIELINSKKNRSAKKTTVTDLHRSFLTSLSFSFFPSYPE